MKNQELRSYCSFNFRRYSDPWVTKCGARCQPDFTAKVGCYTGGYHTGDEGSLIVYEPENEAVYIYGQKDYRNARYTEIDYAIYHSEKFWRKTKKECLDWLAADADERAALMELDCSTDSADH